MGVREIRLPKNPLSSSLRGTSLKAYGLRGNELPPTFFTCVGLVNRYYTHLLGVHLLELAKKRVSLDRASEGLSLSEFFRFGARRRNRLRRGVKLCQTCSISRGLPPFKAHGEWDLDV